ASAGRLQRSKRCKALQEPHGSLLSRTAHAGLSKLVDFLRTHSLPMDAILEKTSKPPTPSQSLIHLETISSSFSSKAGIMSIASCSLTQTHRRVLPTAVPSISLKAPSSAAAVFRLLRSICTPTLMESSVS